MDGEEKISSFDGRKQNWTCWSTKFYTKCKIKSMVELLTNDNLVPSHNKQTRDCSNDEKRARKNNEIIYNDLIMTQDDAECLQIVVDATTNDLPGGSCFKAWKDLNYKFEPKDVNTKIRLQDTFTNCKLERHGDPHIWLSRMVTYRKLLSKNHGTTFTDEDFIIRLKNNIPKNGYREFHMMIEMQLTSNTQELTVEQFQDQLKHFHGMQEDHPVEEMALSTTFPKKGQCNNCGSKGHSADECRKHHIQTNKSEICKACGKQGHPEEQCWKKLKCEYCNSYGHPTYRCFSDPANERFRCMKCGKHGHDASRCRRIIETKFQTRFESKSDANEDDTIAWILFDNYNHDLQEQKDHSINYCAQKKSNNNAPYCTESTWILDSGSTRHVTGDLSLLIDIKDNDNGETAKIGNGTRLDITKTGCIVGTTLQKNGIENKVRINNVAYIPELKMNLLSMNRFIRSGATITNTNETIYITNNERTLTFDQQIDFRDSFLSSLRIKHTRENKINNLVTKTTWDVNILHQRLGHVSLDTLKRVSKKYNIKLTGELKKCTDCAMGGLKRKKINKQDQSRKKLRIGDRIGIDITYINESSIGGAKYWLMGIEYVTAFKISMFLKRKSDLSEKVIDMIK